MEPRTFRSKQMTFGHKVLMCLGAGVIFAITFPSLYRLSTVDRVPRLFNPFSTPEPNWAAIVAACFGLVICVGLLSLFQAKRWGGNYVVLLGETLSEYNFKDQLMARGRIDEIVFIEPLFVLKYKSYVVRFSNWQFIVLASGSEELEELKQFVLSRTDIQPEPRRNMPFQSLGEEIRKRRPLT